MWAKALFEIRRFGVDLGGKLGSWRLSIVLMVLAALYYALLAIWAGSSPPHVVHNIATLIPFWLVYALLLVNTGVCLWRRIPLLRRDLASGRWTALGTFLFHGAFFLVAAGFFVTVLTHQEAKVWVATGENYTGRTEQFLSHSPPRPFVAGVPLVPFRVERIQPEFWRDQLLFTTLEADLVLGDGVPVTTRINRPVQVGLGTFVRMSGFGYAPRWELIDRDGQTIDSAFVKMNVFPPGQRDYFTVPEYPHRFSVEVLPDLVVENGVPRSRSPQLVRPGIALAVRRGRLDLGEALLAGDESYEFEGLTVRFPEIRYWGEFSIVYDPGAPILFAGYALGLAGLVLKLFRSQPEGPAGATGR